MEPTQDSAKQNDAPANYENAFMYWHERAMAADQTVERLERERDETIKERDEQGQLKSRVYREKLLLENEYFKVLSRAVFAEKEIKDVEKRTEQQVAQLREERDALRDSVCDMNNDLVAGDAQIESLGSELTTLRGLVHELMETWVNGRKVCDGIPLSLRERVEGALPREGGAQEPTERQIREMFMRGVKAAEADPKGGEHDQ